MKLIGYLIKETMSNEGLKKDLEEYLKKQIDPINKKMIEQETQFENDLSLSIEQDLLTETIDSTCMDKLEANIINLIKVTPQTKNKLKVETESNNHNEESFNYIKDIAQTLTSKKSMMTFVPIAVVFVLLFTVQNITNNISKKASFSDDSNKKIAAKLITYTANREISSLYGYNHNNMYNGYISGISEKISSFDTAIQKTILHKINSIKFSKKHYSTSTLVSYNFMHP